MPAINKIRALKLVFINLMVLLLLLEITSVAAYFVRTRELFYIRNKDRINVTAANLGIEGQRKSGIPRPINVFHPYFGYVYRKGYVEGKNSTNNYGFLSQFDLPFKRRTQSQFIIGIVGGSVAARAAFHEFEFHTLADALQRIPLFSNRDIVVLNLAVGAYKQPQQLLVLSYLLSIGQELDMVINIDGFNEIAFSFETNRAGMELTMPAFWISSALASLANKDLTSKGLGLLETKTRLRTALEELNNCRLATCYTFRWMYVTYLMKGYLKDLERLNDPDPAPQEFSLVHFNRSDEPLSDSQIIPRSVDVWANSSLIMHNLLLAKGISYFHFVQPNQYYATNRQYTPAEKRIAFSGNSAFKEGASKGYPELVSRVGDLRVAGINVFNAVNIFDHVPEPVYADNCCHFNHRGNSILLAHIAENVTRRFSGRSIPRLKQ